MRPAVLGPLLASLVVALLASCARETPVELGNRTQVLHQNIGGEPADLDPHLLQTNAHFNVLMALGEGLVNYDPRDLHPVPGVAERWEISTDGLVYTFHLRADARWSNGDPVTASDFVFSAQRILSPALGSTFRNYFDDVRGAREFTASGARDFSLVGIRALDARTLCIELVHPAPHLLFLLGNWSWYPVHRPTIEKYGRSDEPFTGWSRPGHHVGNGPFVLADWRPGQVIVVKKNPRYWGAAAVRLNEIDFHVIESADTEERAFRAGQLHLTQNVPSSKLRPYAERSPELLRVAPFFSTYFYAFDTTRPPFSDARVRQAFSLALDRARLVAAFPHAGYRAAFSVTPPDTTGYTYDGDARLRFAPAEARRLLAAAGYPEGRGFPVVDLSINTDLRHQELAEIAQQMWHQHLGVDVRVFNQETKVFHAARMARKLQLWRSGWVGDFIDPFAFLTLMLSNAGENLTGYANLEFDRRAREAAQTVGPATRLARYRDAESLLLRDLPLVPVFYDSSRHLVSPALHGYYSNLLDFHPYQAMWLEGRN